MSVQLERFSIDELVDAGPIEAGILEAIEQSLLEHRHEGNDRAAVDAVFNTRHKLVRGDLAIVPVEPFATVCKAVQAFQRAHGRPISAINMSATLLPYDGHRVQDWHTDFSDNAFVATTKAATEHLRGNVMAESRDLVTLALYGILAEDDDLVNNQTIQVVSHPLGNLIAVPKKVIHRSPIAPEGVVDTRVLVIANVLPVVHPF